MPFEDSHFSSANTQPPDGNGEGMTVEATVSTEGEGVGAAYSPVTAALLIIVCSIIITGTIIGNVLVCTAVSIVRKLRQSPSNWLIVSLAVADLLVALIVMPLATNYEVMGLWTLDQTVCDMWTSLDVLLCTASILNLCMISVDRYFVITKPFQYGIKRTPARMAAMIAAVWLLSALISIPPLFGFNKAPAVAGHCELSQDIGYQFYATIGAFYLPLTVMIVIYARIYVVSSRIAAAEARSKPVERASSSVSTSGHGGWHHRKSSSGGGGGGVGGGEGGLEGTRRTSSSSFYVGGGMSKRGSGARDLDEGAVQYGRGGGVGGGGGGGVSGQSTRQNSEDATSSHSKVPLTMRKSFSFLHRSGGGGGGRSGSVFHRGISTSSSSSTTSHHPSSKSERKATKTLGVIMGAFTACWLPFFVLALVKPFLIDPTAIPNWLGSTLQWLGFANSFFNPIIYARFNREFRTPFKEILLGRCRGINVRLRSESYAEQYGSGHTASFVQGDGVGGALRRSSTCPSAASRPSSGVGVHFGGSLALSGGVGEGRMSDADGFLLPPQPQSPAPLQTPPPLLGEDDVFSGRARDSKTNNNGTDRSISSHHNVVILDCNRKTDTQL